MKTGQVTIKDIARELKISPSTVSRALKNHPDISQETKKAVMELANQMDYQPNIIALSLRKRKTNTIGVIVPKIVHHFFSTIISGIEDVAYAEGYNVIITQSDESYQREVDCVFALVSSRVDGLFMSLSSETTDYEHLQVLNKRNIPVIFLDRACDGIFSSKVLVDDHDGSFLATEHLIQQGCKKLLHLAAPDTMEIAKERKQGFLDALAKYKIAPITQAIVYGDSLQLGYETVKKLLADKIEFDGIFAVNDETAIGAMRALKEAGKRIPQDVAVIGFGDNPVCEVVEPTLSSIKQPGFEMGQIAAQLFMKQTALVEKKEDYEAEVKVLKTSLVIRESSKRK
jgi:LacI family transcriptional regulator